MTDEFERIERLKARFLQTNGDVSTHIGDDAAVLRAGSSDQALSVDTAVEGVHFRRSFASMFEIGRRAILTAASDLVAMGASPKASLSALTLPDTIDDALFDELIAGIADGADRSGAHVIGGNLSRGDTLSITTTVIGSVKKRAVLRSLASVGDSIYVTGRPGESALGLNVLLNKLNAEDLRAVRFVDAWRTPDVPFHMAEQLHALATAAIDISDGFIQDLSHICRASNVGARVDLQRLPMSDDFKEASRRLEKDPLHFALHGGEDYQLIFCSKDSNLDLPNVTRIGSVEKETGVRLVDKNGEIAVNDDATGFEHQWPGNR